ncbi:hypothetical protein CDD82_1502 [Ophiocordyceps australis]|uniref:Sugar phosphate phosphatase n=1 Tax=Ophiocordyceps australis TaxID=1399860 RepID=A0A2C5XMG7_9HYPO|nr:hypothetical protein CDD82_1502 [Ophiocordyceps australis]
MEFDTQTPQSVTSDPTSFASDSVRKRWPVILTGAIDDMHRTVAQTDHADKQAEGKKIIEQLATLKYEIQHNRKLTPIVDDGFSHEVAAYNKEIEQRATPTWFDLGWLFGECYMYRRISTFFSLSKHWKDYDLFARQKIDTFRTSRAAVLELAARYRELMHQPKIHDPDAEKTCRS